MNWHQEGTSLWMCNFIFDIDICGSFYWYSGWFWILVSQTAHAFFCEVLWNESVDGLQEVYVDIGEDLK